MVQFKAISKIDTSGALLRKLEQASLDVKKHVLRGLADEVIKNSPVDTGNYMLSHEIAAGGRDGSFSTAPTNSHGLPRGQARGSKAASARSALNSIIDGIQPTDSQFMLRNSAIYAPRVEYGGWGAGSGAPAVGATRGQREAQARSATQPYHVYSRARAAAPALIQRALAEFEARMAT
jgi:hypothetical protein